MSHFLTQSSLGFGASLAASANSIGMDCQNMSKVSFQITHSGGTVDWDATIEESNDGTNWVATDSTVAISASGSVLVDRIDVCSRYVRLALVRTSGTLTGLSTVFNGKF